MLINHNQLLIIYYTTFFRLKPGLGRTKPSLAQNIYSDKEIFNFVLRASLTFCKKERLGL